MSGLIERFYFKEHLLFCYFQIFVKDTKNDSCPRQERFRVLTFGNHWCSFWKTLSAKRGVQLRHVSSIWRLQQTWNYMEVMASVALLLAVVPLQKFLTLLRFALCRMKMALPSPRWNSKPASPSKHLSEHFFFPNRNETFQSSVLPQK